MANPRVQQLLEIIARAYDRHSWHGTNLRGSIRGLDAAIAARRPGPARHNVWELVVHAAYWKYVAWRRMSGEKRGGFPLDGSNWFERPVAGHDTPAAWKQDVKLLGAMHDQLVTAVARLPDRALDRGAPGSSVTNFELIAGVAAHDLYHAGQIQLVKRMVS
jgi:hypothetical protein